jgi:hypothetical protein
MARRSSRRGKARRRAAEAARDPFARRRVRFEQIMRPLGWWGEFSALPKEWQAWFFKRKVPDAVVRLDLSRRWRGEAAELTKKFEAAMAEATYELDGQAYPARTFFSVIETLTRCCTQRPGAVLPPAVSAFVERVGPIVQEMRGDEMMRASFEMYKQLAHVAAARSRIDGCFLTLRLHRRVGEYNELITEIVVAEEPAQTRRIAVDGKPRPAHRVGVESPDGSVRWAAWTDAQCADGRTTSGGDRPVFVQGHALHELRKRIALPPMRPHLDAWLAHNLAEPELIERQRGGAWLAAFKLGEQRLGYFVCEPLSDCVLVRTFLFLTHPAVPEGRRLKEKLHLASGVAQWLGLHELTPYTRTDLRDDDELVALFRECGCGHLFELDEECYAPDPKPFAAEVQKYVKAAA